MNISVLKKEDFDRRSFVYTIHVFDEFEITEEVLADLDQSSPTAYTDLVQGKFDEALEKMAYKILESLGKNKKLLNDPSVTEGEIVEEKCGQSLPLVTKNI